MVSQRIHGKIVFVSSFLGYASFAGYSPYAPGKYALRGKSSPVDLTQSATDWSGLADTLRSELLLHSISVHIFMPCGIQSAGYEAEQRMKPRITKKIEESDDILPAEDVSKSLIAGKSTAYLD